MEANGHFIGTHEMHQSVMFAITGSARRVLLKAAPAPINDTYCSGPRSGVILNK